MIFLYLYFKKMIRILATSWLILVVCSEDLYIDDLEDKLAEGLLSLSTMVDDGSIEEVWISYLI